MRQESCLIFQVKVCDPAVAEIIYFPGLRERSSCKRNEASRPSVTLMNILDEYQNKTHPDTACKAEYIRTNKML